MIPSEDIDGELVLGRRVGDPREALRYATASGRSFSTYLDRLMWPQTGAVQILRSRSVAINITLEDIDLLTDNVDTIYSIFEDSSAIPPPQPGMLNRPTTA